MTDNEFYGGLERLIAEGRERMRAGIRTGGNRANIELFVRSSRTGEGNGWARFARRVAIHAVSAVALGGYILSGALAVLAITVGVECSAGSMEPGAWVAYVLAALLSMVMGVTAHAVHDGIE